MDKCLVFFPFNITPILTDNGLEFTNRLLKSKTGNSCQKHSKMDVKYLENKIQHRLKAPFTPKTNDMVERVDGIIKNNTILKTQYQSLDEMKNDLTKFLSLYNFNRRHGKLRKEIKVKTPFNAIEKWYQLKPETFKITPSQFKKNILKLNQN